jgi:hypothetical protein
MSTLCRARRECQGINTERVRGFLFLARKISGFADRIPSGLLEKGLNLWVGCGQSQSNQYGGPNWQPKVCKMFSMNILQINSGQTQSKPVKPSQTDLRSLWASRFHKPHKSHSSHPFCISKVERINDPAQYELMSFAE